MFTTLLQVRRAVQVLNMHRLLNDMTASPTAEQALYYTLRSKLLWFCSTFHSYLATLVLAPGIAKLRGDLKGAVDVDAMIGHPRAVREIARG